MNLRILPSAAGAVALALALAPGAPAAPLAGKGENIEPIAHLPIDESDVNELELAGDHAYVSYDNGLDIVDISDPGNPRTVGELICQDGGWGDIDISPDAAIAVLPAAHPTADPPCEGAGTAATIVDVSDKKNPRILSKIDLEEDKVIDYVHTVTLDGNRLLLNPQTAAFYPQDSAEPRIRVFDISDPRKPVEQPPIVFGPAVQAVAHDSFVDHRPDGRALLYAASIHTTDVLDITDPMQATMLQRTVQPDTTISHQAQPNFDRKVLVLSDESLIDQNGEADGICGRVGSGAMAADVGSTHFFGLEEDGTISNNGLAPIGSYNRELRDTPRTCTSHVFWLAPDENRLTQAWYSEGARILDFSDPAEPKELGSFTAEPSTLYWSVKPHRGYLYATDIERGLDVLRYTGEGGSRWPATAGPAEVQRAGFQGVPYRSLPTRAGTGSGNAGGGGGGGGDTGGTPPTGPSGGPPPPGAQPPAPGRAAGRFAFVARVAAKRGARLTLAFRRNRRQVAELRFRRGAARRVTVRGVARPGTYRWAIRRGGRTLRRGRLVVRRTDGLRLSANGWVIARARS